MTWHGYPVWTFSVLRPKKGQRESPEELTSLQPRRAARSKKPLH
jgi:hypothetical protein